MNIFGMGTFELLVVLIVAFIVLGPVRMVDAAKVMGRLINEARKITQAIPEIVSDEAPTGLNDEKTLDKSIESNIDVGDQTDDGKITTSRLGMDGPVAFDRAPINDEPEDALEGTDLEKI